MHAILTRLNGVLQIAVAVFSYVAGTLRVPSACPTRTACSSRTSDTARGACLLHCFTLVAVAASAQADIFQWEYTNPLDPSQGKRQSATLVPDGAGVDAVTGADLSSRNLSMAYLIGANVQNASFFRAALTDADFTGAEIQGASFLPRPLSCSGFGCRWIPVGTGITVAQLYSTASYQAQDLSGIDVSLHNLAGANFAGQNLTKASFNAATLSQASFRNANLFNASLNDATLTGADFGQANLANAKFNAATLTSADFTGANLTGAEVRNATFDSIRGFSAAQLYSTASYQAHDLTGIRLGGSDLRGWHFAGQNLTGSSFRGARLAAADFTGAQVSHADFSDTDVTLGQLYSTASYQANDLPRIGLAHHNLASANFAGQNLWQANLRGANLIDANLTDANLSGASLTDTDLSGAEIRGAKFDLVVDCNSSSSCRLVGGLKLSQIYSTASYQARDLSGISLARNHLAGGAFNGQKLTDANFYFATLTGADFTEANLTNAIFLGATLSDANFRGAEVRGANFGKYSNEGTGITLEQLYSTASYLAQDLRGIDITGNFSGGSFAGQNLADAAFDGNLSNADFTQAILTGASLSGDLAGADLAGAVVRGASLHRITLAQLYSTASYQAHDLTGIRLGYNDLRAGNFAGQDLTNAWFQYATLTDADFRQANLTNADFGAATLTDANFTDAEIRGANFGGTSVTIAQLYSTASYRSGDLSGLALDSNNLTGAKFAGQNLANTDFSYATLTDADFSGAEVRGASFRADRYTKTGGITLPQLYSTVSYQAHDLSGVNLGNNDLAGANFANQTLTNVNLEGAKLTGTDLTGAEVRGTSFSAIYGNGTGITLAQLYSTASYHARDLTGVNLSWNDLTGGNFAGLNLANAIFWDTTLTGGSFAEANAAGAIFDYADLSGANLRHANLANSKFHGSGFCAIPEGCAPSDATVTGADMTAADGRGAVLFDAPDAITNNLIWPDGHIHGLGLDAGGLLLVRDYDGDPKYGNPLPPIAISIDQHLSMGPGGTLRMVFEADAWDSTVSFAPGIPVTLGGTLELTFAADVNLASQVGRTFDLFDWTGVTPTGAFAVSTPYAWDLSNLYTTGELTLTAIPEPATFLLVALALLGAVFRVRRPLRRSDSSSNSNEEPHAESQRRSGVGIGRYSLRPQRLCVSLFSIMIFAGTARADIFQWEYTNAADPSQGKRQSTTLAPDGAGVDAVPGAYLSGRDLTKAYLIGSDMHEANLATFVIRRPPPSYFPVPYYINLTSADLSHANLRKANFTGAILTDANFAGADIQAARFSKLSSLFSSFYGTGLTPAQLYSTASYQNGDLSGIAYDFNNLAGVNFVGQNLVDASFYGATLTSADFTAAEIREANFARYHYQDEAGITLAQLYSTASYLARDLSGINFNWTNLAGGNFIGQNLTNASFIDAAVAGADFTGAQVTGTRFDSNLGNGISLAQLYATVSYQTKDLTGISLSGNDLSGGNFAEQNLTNANFLDATLTDANFTDTLVQGASFSLSTGSTDSPPVGETGAASGAGYGVAVNQLITEAQLYSTASYQARNLKGIELVFGNLSGWNFSGQNLTGAKFGGANLTGANFREANLTNTNFLYYFCNLGVCRYDDATLTGADLTAADARGASSIEPSDLSDVTTSNLIWPDGHIDGLDLNDSGLFVVHDYDGDPRTVDHYGNPTNPISRIPISVGQHFVIVPGAALRMVFEADAWDSTISFAPGIPVTLGGTLELTFANDVNPASQLGRTFDLFDWTGVHPTGAFAVSSPYAWDLSNLYTTGEVTLTTVPEPASVEFAAVVGVFVLVAWVRASRTRTGWTDRRPTLTNAEGVQLQSPGSPRSGAPWVSKSSSPLRRRRYTDRDAFAPSTTAGHW